MSWCTAFCKLLLFHAKPSWVIKITLSYVGPSEGRRKHLNTHFVSFWFSTLQCFLVSVLSLHTESTVSVIHCYVNDCVHVCTIKEKGIQNKTIVLEWWLETLSFWGKIVRMTTARNSRNNEVDCLKKERKKNPFWPLLFLRFSDLVLSWAHMHCTLPNYPLVIITDYCADSMTTARTFPWGVSKHLYILPYR